METKRTELDAMNALRVEAVAECNRLRALNAELVKIIDMYLSTAHAAPKKIGKYRMDLADVDTLARAALAKAQG